MKKHDKKILIVVTKEDIASGCRSSPHQCPVALAAKRAGVTASFGIGVFYDKIIRYGGRQNCSSIPLPSRAQKFIRDFDGFICVKPFRFTINY